MRFIQNHLKDVIDNAYEYVSIMEINPDMDSADAFRECLENNYAPDELVEMFEEKKRLCNFIMEFIPK